MIGPLLVAATAALANSQIAERLLLGDAAEETVARQNVGLNTASKADVNPQTGRSREVEALHAMAA